MYIWREYWTYINIKVSLRDTSKYISYSPNKINIFVELQGRGKEWQSYIFILKAWAANA